MVQQALRSVKSGYACLLTCCLKVIDVRLRYRQQGGFGDFLQEVHLSTPSDLQKCQDGRLSHGKTNEWPCWVSITLRCEACWMWGSAMHEKQWLPDSRVPVHMTMGISLDKGCCIAEQLLHLYLHQKRIMPVQNALPYIKYKFSEEIIVKLRT